MKLGISAFAWTASFNVSHVDLVSKVREYGFAAFEIPMFVPGVLPVKALRKAFEESDLACTVCAILPPAINPISSDAATRKRSFDHLVECVETAAAMGAHLLGGPVYAPIGYLPEHRPTAAERSWAVELFQALGEHLDEHDVALSIEPVNRSETFFLRTAREARELCEAVAHPRVGVTIDTFHANIEEKNVAEAMRLLGTHLRHIHASENDRGGLGKGHVDFMAVLEAMKHISYDGYVMIEGFGYSANERVSPGWLWADESVSPEELAVQGFSYLTALQALCQG